jgi:hypothetical protein
LQIRKPLLSVLTALFGLRVIEVAFGRTRGVQSSGAAPEARERVALKVIAVLFFALGAYVTVESLRSLLGAEAAEHSTSVS